MRSLPSAPPLAVALAVLAGFGGLAHDAAADSSAPGDATRRRLTAAHSRLAEDERRLVAVLRSEAPQLALGLHAGGDEPLLPGWMQLPTIVTDSPRGGEPKAPRPRSWSWAGIEPLLGAFESALAEFESKLATRPAPGDSVPMESRPDRLVRDHERLLASERRIAADVRHLAFWQDALRETWPHCLGEMRRHDLLLERWELRTRLGAVSGDAPQGAAEATRLAAIEAELSAARSGPDVPAFLTVEQRSRDSVVLHVPLVTDVGRDFAERFREAAESTWQADQHGVHYSLELDVTIIRRRAMLRRAKALGLPPSAVPRAGDAVDLAAHLQLFPAGAAILTSGAVTTHARVGRLVALGPQDVAPNVLAHEFGHVLGFVDGYVRACREVAGEGLEIIEVVPDPYDIMDEPTVGRVFPAHFQALLAALEARPD